MGANCEGDGNRDKEEGAEEIAEKAPIKISLRDGWKKTDRGDDSSVKLRDRKCSWRR